MARLWYIDGGAEKKLKEKYFFIMEKNDFEKKLFEIFAHFWDFLHFAVVILVRICNNNDNVRKITEI